MRRNWNIEMMECWKDGETVKTVELNLPRCPTPLKRGVNKSGWCSFVYFDYFVVDA
jgi:hypothetical protein